MNQEPNTPQGHSTANKSSSMITPDQKNKDETNIPIEQLCDKFNEG